jgi:FkbM family methyltransferase
LHERFLGLQIHFKSYPELIQLFEEIFIGRIYDVPLETPLIVDCGSNIGISVLYFKAVYPGCRLLAFEPEENNYALLQKNVDSNRLQNVTINKVALADTPGEQFLANPGSTSLNWRLNNSGGGTVRVPTHRLSAYIDEPVGLLKIDVEGAENLIMNDLIQTGKIDFIENVVLEHHTGLHGQPVKDFMLRLDLAGFDCRAARSSVVPETTEVMVWCKRKRF